MGGGGKGMRLIHSEDEVVEAYNTARSESMSSFGDDTVYLEKFVEEPHHIEFQILGDNHGNVIHLFDRECSVLENYRKVNSVKEFAGLYYVSERTFSRKFHSCFGESPYKWIQKKKAEQIREIIRDSEFSLKIIAKQFGFSSLAYFTTYCKRVLGVSPSQLRRKNNRTDK